MSDPGRDSNEECGAGTVDAGSMAANELAPADDVTEPADTDPRRSRYTVQLAAIAGGAAAVRLVVFVVHHRGRDLGFNDAPYYSGQAMGLARGHWFVDPATGGPGAEHGPLTAVLLAPVSRLADPRDAQRLVTIAAGVLCVVVIALTARALATPSEHAREIGLVAGLLAAVYPNLWLNDGIVMSESFATLLVAAWLLAATAYHRGPSNRLAIAVAAIGALAALTRSELAVLALVGLVLVLRDTSSPRAPAAGRYVAVLLVVVGPWVGPNLARFDEPVLMTTNDGTTLRGANCDRTYGGRELGSWSIFCLVIEPDLVRAEPSIRSREWRADGIGYAVDHLDRVPVVVAARIGRTLDLFGWSYQIDEDVRDDRPRWGSIMGIAAFLAAAPFAAMGIARQRGRPRRLLLVPVATVAVTTVAFYGGHRIRAPLEPVVVIGAAFAVVELARRTTGRTPALVDRSGCVDG